MEKTVLKDPIYKASVTLLTGDIEEVKKYLKENYGYGYELINLGYYLGKKDGSHWIYIKDLNDTYVIAHECIHLVNGIYKERGLNLDLNKDDEHYAYYLAYWMNQICNLKMGGG